MDSNSHERTQFYILARQQYPVWWLSAWRPSLLHFRESYRHSTSV